ncbi:MAG TPA: multicopper oxidase family protein [Polyangia bacterium]|nr:multicopper oxidase family protein [Polyangia bacterium]
MRTQSATSAAPDLDVVLRARPARMMIDAAAGKETDVWRFEGSRLSGRASAFSEEGLGYLGPTFRLRTGERVRVRFENGLGEDSIVHWHGLDVTEENDGHPRFAVGAGGTRRYDLTIADRPGTYWYHPHPDGRTGYQVHAGMAGLFLVTDDDDQARGLPASEFDLPLVIQDRLIDGNGQLVYAPNPMLGFLGDRILVNGRADAVVAVKAGSYRLRLVNGSNSRIYKLAWSDQSPITVIGTDGGLLGSPVVRPYVMLAPGERMEVWADFGRMPGGDDVWLESRAFAATGGMMGGGMMGGGMMGGRGLTESGLANGAAFRVCRFAVSGKAPRLPVPRSLSPVVWRPAEEVVNPTAPRRFRVSMAMMRWMLNGEAFQMMAVAPNERIKLGVTEDWEFWNTAGMMTMAHPIHLHGGQFQVVERTVAPAWRAVADSMSEGLVDDGWKDTFLLRPGEQVRIRVRFARHAGLFLYHCHNLEHEDMGMMRNFRVES